MNPSMHPLFSVVIPLYNKAHFVGATLAGVLAQSFEDYEVIVVNDGSTDDSEAKVLAVADSRIRYVKTENRGVSSARNLGISLAKGMFVAFLDADDYWYPDYLQEISTKIHIFPEQQVFATAIEFEHQGQTSKAVYSLNVDKECQLVDYFSASLKQSILFTSASVFQRGVFERVGLFDEAIKRGEDIDLWVRIGLHYSILFISKICVRYSYAADSLSRKGSDMSECATFDSYTEFERENKALRVFLDYNRFSLAVKSKLLGDRLWFKHFYDRISLQNLPWRKRFLLHLPAFCLRLLIRLRSFLMKRGISRSVFVE